MVKQFLICHQLQEMKLRPTVLMEYKKDKGLKAALGASNFCSDDDTIVLEDEAARMKISGPGLPVDELVTGGCGGRQPAVRSSGHVAS